MPIAPLLSTHMPFPFNHVLEFLYYLLSVCLFLCTFFHSTLLDYTTILNRAVLVLRTAYLLPLYLFSIHSLEFSFFFEGNFFKLLNLAHCGIVSDFLLLHHYYCHTGFGISWDPLGSLLSWYYLYVHIIIIYMRSVLLATLINIQHMGVWM